MARRKNCSRGVASGNRCRIPASAQFAGCPSQSGYQSRLLSGSHSAPLRRYLPFLDGLGRASHIVQVRIEDAEGHCERARQNGAIILTEPKDHPYGERQYNAEDFHGHRWDFTETIADIAPEEWSGGAFHLE